MSECPIWASLSGAPVAGRKENVTRFRASSLPRTERRKPLSFNGSPPKYICAVHLLPLGGMTADLMCDGRTQAAPSGYGVGLIERNRYAPSTPVRKCPNRENSDLASGSRFRGAGDRIGCMHWPARFRPWPLNRLPCLIANASGDINDHRRRDHSCRSVAASRCPLKSARMVDRNRPADCLGIFAYQATQTSRQFSMAAPAALAQTMSRRLYMSLLIVSFVSVAVYLTNLVSLDGLTLRSPPMSRDCEVRIGCHVERVWK